jgi:hypothetical protein
MSLKSRSTIAAMAAAGAFFLTAPAAEARIVCNEGFQTVGGSQLATPYCQDNYVGEVARRYGIKVSNVAIRENPNVKRHVCNLIGRDIRVSLTCSDANSYGRRGY